MYAIRSYYDMQCVGSFAELYFCFVYPCDGIMLCKSCDDTMVQIAVTIDYGYVIALFQT